MKISYFPTVDKNFADEVTPNYEEFEFKISQFPTLFKNNEIAYSPNFLASGGLWRLKIYCSGIIHIILYYICE